MGVFDTYSIRCPYCNNIVEEQRKPGNMNYYEYGNNPAHDLNFVGNYHCYDCGNQFSVEMETTPKTIIRKI